MSGLYHRLRARSIAALAAHFPAEGLIVDLGCGTGALSRALCIGSPKRRVLAIDHDRARVALARAACEGLPVEVREEAIGASPLPACAGIAIIDVLHYLREHEQEALIAQAAAALAPGGVLVLRDPDAGAGWRFRWNRWHEGIATATGWTRAEVHHYRTAAGWAELLTAHGLTAEVHAPARGLYADRVVAGTRA